MRDADVALDKGAARHLLAVGGDLIYISLDRPDLQFSAKTVMAQAAGLGTYSFD